MPMSRCRVYKSPFPHTLPRRHSQVHSPRGRSSSSRLTPAAAPIAPFRRRSVSCPIRPILPKTLSLQPTNPSTTLTPRLNISVHPQRHIHNTNSSPMFNIFKKKATESKPAPPPKKKMPEPVRTIYESADVSIPDDFLTTQPHDAKPITFTQIDWTKTPLPQFDGGYAVILDNVLSPSECKTLISLAESSVLEKDRWPLPGASEPAADGSGAFTYTTPVDRSAWRPAMVNIGGGFEVLETTYRNSDRIVWDSQEILDRIWKHRLLPVPEIGGGGDGVRGSDEKKSNKKSPLLEFRQGDLLGYKPVTVWDHVRKRYTVPPNPSLAWKYARMNKRMRFLKYGPGQFFRAHCDGAYSERDEKGDVELQTHFTVHLYLNDSQQAILAENSHLTDKMNDVEKREFLSKWEAENMDVANGEKLDLVGGATSFLSNDEKKKIDVDPRAGRVLIFQHRRLYHAGDDVIAGTKYTMRAEMMYRKETEEEYAAEHGAEDKDEEAKEEASEDSTKQDVDRRSVGWIV